MPRITTNSKAVNLYYYTSMAIGISYFIYYALIYPANPFANILFADPLRHYTDFFDSLAIQVGNPYDAHSTYPPVANLIFEFFSKMATKKTNYLILDHDLMLRAGAGSRLFSFQKYSNSLLLYNIFVISSLSILIFINKKGGEFEKASIVFFILFSQPFLFMFDRGNIIAFSLVTLMAFVFGKDSNNKWIKEISLVSLALSASVKIYPAVFGLLLVSEKRYFEAIRCTIYGITLFFLPFFFYDGLSTFYRFLENMSIFAASMNSSGFGYKVNASNTLNALILLIEASSYNETIFNNVRLYTPAIIISLSIISLFIIDNKWKRTALMAVTAILVTDSSGVYTLTIMTIPLILFLDTEDRTRLDWLYLLFFIIIFIPIPIHDEGLLNAANISNRGYSHYNLGTILESLAALSMLLTLYIDGIYSSIHVQRKPTLE